MSSSNPNALPPAYNASGAMTWRRQRGVTLMEALVVLGIAGALIMGALQFMSSASSSQDVSTASRNLGMIASGVTSLYSSSAVYDGLDNQVLLDAEIVPTSMIAGTDIINAWDGDVTVAPANSDRDFTIEYTQVPQSACTSLATSTFQSFQELAVGGTTVSTTADAATACSDGANTMTWTAA